MPAILAGCCGENRGKSMLLRRSPYAVAVADAPRVRAQPSVSVVPHHKYFVEPARAAPHRRAMCRRFVPRHVVGCVFADVVSGHAVDLPAAAVRRIPRIGSVFPRSPAIFHNDLAVPPAAADAVPRGFVIQLRRPVGPAAGPFPLPFVFVPIGIAPYNVCMRRRGGISMRRRGGISSAACCFSFCSCSCCSFCFFLLLLLLLLPFASIAFFARR
mmetsp:Transcript_17836/g.44623  ORF Transcript_17836/g.44623 Transcript_17836/m.44623 type:complete len:214 (+) Transcript_17836:621-1262(+)